MDYKVNFLFNSCVSHGRDGANESVRLIGEARREARKSKIIRSYSQENGLKLRGTNGFGSMFAEEGMRDEILTPGSLLVL